MEELKVWLYSVAPPFSPDSYRDGEGKGMRSPSEAKYPGAFNDLLPYQLNISPSAKIICALMACAFNFLLNPKSKNNSVCEGTTEIICFGIAFSEIVLPAWSIKNGHATIRCKLLNQ